MSKVESLESEPLPKKAELEPPDYENFNPKLETADLNWKLGSDVHVSEVLYSQCVFSMRPNVCSMYQGLFLIQN